MFYRSGREFRIETTPVMPAQADGELLMSVTPVLVSVDPLAGCIMVPKKR